MAPPSCLELRVLCLSALLLASAARAQEPSSADTLIRSGLDARRQGRDAEALELFQRAEALDPSPQTRAQIGLAYHALGQWLAAEHALDEALSAKQDAWIEERRAALNEAKGIIAKHLAWLAIYTNAPNARIELAGQPAAAAGATIRTTGGRVSVRITAPGYLSVARELDLAPELTTVETVHLAPVDVTPLFAALPAAAPPTSVRVPTATKLAPASHGASAREPAGWLLLGIGAAALGYGGFLGVRTLQLKSQRDTECTPRGCTSRGLDLDERAREAALLSTVSVALGTGLVASGTWLTITARRSSERSRAALLSAGTTF